MTRVYCFDCYCYGVTLFTRESSFFDACVALSGMVWLLELCVFVFVCFVCMRGVVIKEEGEESERLLLFGARSYLPVSSPFHVGCWIVLRKAFSKISFA